MICIAFCMFSILMGFNSQDLLNNLNIENDWIEISKSKDGRIMYESDTENGKFLKIKKTFTFYPGKIIKIIQSIGNYNNIISNNNVRTKLIHEVADTLFASQIITNAIPFVRNRQYIFKMYKVGDSRVDWHIVNEDHPFNLDYLNNSANTLIIGAGSWEVNNNTLVYKMYVDDEVKLPAYILRKIRMDYVSSIFEDVIKKLD